jgi:hypothetical protein
MRGDVLLKAHKVINGERRDQYGAPEDSFPVIAEMWRQYLMARNGRKDLKLIDEDVAVMMLLLKIARAANGYQDDTWLDAAGYLGIGEDLAAAHTPPSAPGVGTFGDPDGRGSYCGMEDLPEPAPGDLYDVRPPEWPLDLSGSGSYRTSGIRDGDGGLIR